MHGILDACYSNCRLGEVNEKAAEHTLLNQTCRKRHLPEITEHASIPQPPQLNFIQSPHRVTVFSFHTNSKSVLKIKLQPVRGASKKNNGRAYFTERKGRVRWNSPQGHNEKSNNVFISLFLLYSTFLLLYSWTDYEMIDLRASAAFITDHTFSSFMIPFCFQLGRCECEAERNYCFDHIYWHPYVMVYFTLVFPLYNACFHYILGTFIVIHNIYWQSATQCAIGSNKGCPV